MAFAPPDNRRTEPLGMMKVVIGVLAAAVIALGGYFGTEFYIQQRIANEIEASFTQARASDAKATHGKVTFALWNRTVTVADVAAEFTAQPPATVKLERVTASGTKQVDGSRFSADRIEATNLEVVTTMGVQGGLRVVYQAPRIEVTDYSGPAGPQRPLASNAPTPDVFRYVLEHFAAVTAKAAIVPTVTMKMTPAGSSAVAGTGEYTYTGLVLRDIKDGKIASSTIERVNLNTSITTAGKTESLAGEVSNLAAYDFDSAATAALFDPSRANDDRYYRAYRQMTAGAYTVSLQSGRLKMRLDGITIDDVGMRPSKLQYPQLMAIIDAAPPPGTTPTPQQTRDLIAKVAGLYEGIRIGGAEMRGFSMETPDGPFRLGAIRLADLENGRLAEFSLEALDARAKQGAVKVERFALKSLDIANLMRMSAQFAQPGRNPGPEQLVALLTMLEGAELKGLVAPYKDTSKPVNIDTLNISWGQFIGPIPSKARVTVKMSGPLDVTDPEPFRALALGGISSSTVNFDLGAAWSEKTRSFALEPATVDLGGIGNAVAKLSLTNVQREVFSLNPLQAAIMAAQIEAGPVELVVRDTGGIELAIAQQARQQNVSRETARRTMVDNIRESAMKMAAVNPDMMALAGALTRFIENPRGTLTIKLTPRGRVGMMQILDGMKTSPIAALARFQIEATTGR